MQILRTAWTGVLLTSMVAMQLSANPVDDFQTKYTTLQKNLENTAKTVMESMGSETDEFSSHYALKDWEYKNNFNQENLQEKINAAIEYGNWHKQSREQAQAWKELYPELKDANLRRQFSLMSRPQFIDLPDQDMARYHELKAEMDHTFNTKSVCVDFDCGLKLYPEIEEQYRKGHDYEELQRLWLGWRNDLGRTIRPKFRQFIDLSNTGARTLQYKDRGQMGRVPYETGNLKGEIKKEYTSVKRLYDQLFSYVRGSLSEKYGKDNITPRGAIPEHVTGSILGNDWSNIFDTVRPFKNQPSIDATETMEVEKYDPEQVYRMADKFYQSLGMERLPTKFYQHSVFSRTPGKEMSCVPEMFEISYQQNSKDFRIKTCMNPSFKQYMEAFENIGRYHYSSQYGDQPSIFRMPASPGFENLVGKTVSLSAATPQQLNRDKLIKNGEMNEPQSINFLMKQALRILPSMMDSYMKENYRWDMFEGKVQFDDLNCHWTQMRHELMGLVPPQMRTEYNFDPAADLESLTREDNIKDFISGVTQFQLFKHLCEGNQRPLHQCDLYNSKPAGEKLTQLMKQGASRPWKEVLKSVTGENEMSSAALMEYFKPLMDWLSNENQKNSEFVGWEKGDNQYCVKEVNDSKQRSDLNCVYVRTLGGVECM